MDEVMIGARLRTLRRWRGMTQAELAGLSGLSPSFLSMVEHGKRMLDRRSHIAALAGALRVSGLAVFLGGQCRDLAAGDRGGAGRKRGRGP
jgi:transcriptional regulator with XRE-family HTH domain